MYPRLRRLIPLFSLPLVGLAQPDNAHFRVAELSPEQPNILWIYIEDTNAWMSCYGDTLIETPNIDALARVGVRFDRAYMTAGVCSPTRSANITGMYQTSIGAHEHYSSFSRFRGNEMEVWDPNHLGVRTLPEIFRSAGYYTFNQGKNHYNFVFTDDVLYDHRDPSNGFHGAKNGTDWSTVPEGQPFFGQIQLLGDKFSNPQQVVQPEDVSVPPYYPDVPVIREYIAHHYNTILELDRITGEIVAALKRDNLYDNTVIFFFSDHGCGLPRSKQFLYEGGIRVPLIISGPGVPVNQARDDLVSGIDIAATSLALAGIDIPDTMHGMDMFAPDFQRDFVVAARDRCDYTIDHIRAIVTPRYKYLRNFKTDRPYLQPNYRDAWDTVKTLHRMFANGELNDTQAHFAGDVRPAEELYDLVKDPYETVNLVHSYKREHAVALAEHRQMLYRWMIETNDRGLFPESDDALRAVIDRWGDAAVNPEYQRVREVDSTDLSAR